MVMKRCWAKQHLSGRTVCQDSVCSDVLKKVQCLGSNLRSKPWATVVSDLTYPNDQLDLSSTECTKTRDCQDYRLESLLMPCWEGRHRKRAWEGLRTYQYSSKIVAMALVSNIIKISLSAYLLTSVFDDFSTQQGGQQGAWLSLCCCHRKRQSNQPLILCGQHHDSLSWLQYATLFGGSLSTRLCFGIQDSATITK